MTTKTILLEDSTELHLDSVGDQIELSVKERSRWGLSELSRVRLNKQKLTALQEALYLAGAKEAI